MSASYYILSSFIFCTEIRRVTVEFYVNKESNWKDLFIQSHILTLYICTDVSFSFFFLLRFLFFVVYLYDVLLCQTGGHNFEIANFANMIAMNVVEKSNNCASITSFFNFIFLYFGQYAVFSLLNARRGQQHNNNKKSAKYRIVNIIWPVNQIYYI